MELKPNTQLQEGVYTIIKTLGSGGFGITYLAESGSKRLCIKEFFPGDYYTRCENGTDARAISERFSKDMKRYRTKFRKEALNIARFNVDNIVKIHDVFDENNTSYYVMDYIDGESLYDIIRNNGAPLSEARALRYIRQAATALAHIHSQNTVHLDIKPNNIMIRRRDDMAMVIDFGLSKHFNEDGTPSSTTPGGFSRGYTPLEMYQTQKERTFLPSTDIYSLGATLYTLLTGVVPPEATEIPLNGLPKMPETISATTRNAIIRAMQPNPNQRPQTIDEFVALLDGDEIPDITEVIDEPPVEEDTHLDANANRGVQDDVHAEDDAHDTPALRKIKDAITKHFDEAGRRGLIINTNKKDRLITEIFVEDKLFLRIISRANAIGQYRVYAKSQTVVEIVTKIVNQGKTSISLDKEYSVGNAPQKLIQSLSTIISEIGWRLNDRHITVKTEVEHAGSRIVFDVLLWSAMLPGLFALIAWTLINIDHPNIGAVMCSGPAFSLALIFLSIFRGNREPAIVKIKSIAAVVSLFFLIFILFGVIDRWMIYDNSDYDYAWLASWRMSGDGKATLIVYAISLCVYFIAMVYIKFKQYVKWGYILAIIGVSYPLYVTGIANGWGYSSEEVFITYLIILIPLVLLSFIDRKRYKIE